MIKKPLLKLLALYQYISKLFPASCRYYPTCSEYARWQFEHNRIDKAFISSFFRICRCNQLFDGGIDYPRISLKLGKTSYGTLTKVRYWYVPVGDKKNRFHVIKSFD
ncbi:MAG: membrane protein insertion efficiency factor YidD [Campylobacterota bacterium]